MATEIRFKINKDPISWVTHFVGMIGSVVGLVFLVIVFWSPDGILGLWDRWRNRMNATDKLTGEIQGGDGGRGA